ncbi:hypothetical protein GCM10007415_07560 [Parapedobacter pyrenivorans]|uniref:Uncharacterized protein n=2 Tax=Parapedobacter pyrenivorans TaxID=1305674 RepID=A0A917M4W2_9SPHI|nr:hypothetical protein GCM10007415_07560 [Parapedobacter pyrenivorans]
MDYVMTLFQKYILVAIIGLTFIACGGQGGADHQTQTERAADEHFNISDSLMLVPGQSAGAFRLGDSDRVVHRLLGNPDFSNAAMGKAVLMWYTDTDSSYPLSIFTSRDMGNDETARIKQIRITSPHFETQESIHVGAALSEISDAYAKPLRIVETYAGKGGMYSIYDTDEGIAFEVDADDRCIAIIIHEPHTGVTSYLPLRAIN